MRPISLFVAAVLGTAASTAMGQTRQPVTIEALLDQESLGQVRIDPGGRWIVVERRAAWSAAATYRFGLMTSQLLTGLEIHDASSDQPPRRIDDPGHATGYVSGPFSPSGEKMLVFRLTETSWRLGVLTLATGDLQWLPLTPEYTGLGRTVAWRSETEVAVIARATDDLPLLFRLGWQTEARKTALWRRFETGHTPSAVYIPSGTRRDSREQASPARLILIDLTSGDEQRLATGELFDFELSPDAETIAAVLNAEDLQADDDAPVRVGTPSRRRQLVLVDIRRGRVTSPLPDQDVLSHLLTWSPDGRSVLVFGRTGGVPWGEGRFWQVDRDGSTRALPLGQSIPWINQEADGIPIARGGWSHGAPVVQVRTPESVRAWLRVQADAGPVRLREPTERLVQMNGQAWVERGDGLHPFAMPEKNREPPGRLQSRERASDAGGRARTNPVDTGGRGQAVLINDNCASPLFAPEIRTCLGPLAQDEMLVAASPDARFIVTQRKADTGATVLMRRDGQGDHPLATLNTDLGHLAWGPIEAIRHPGPEGAALTSWLLLPPPRDDGALAPLVVILYPGATYPTAPAWLRPGGDRRHINPAVLAANGYAVLVPSLPRSAGSGPGLDDLAARITAIVDQAAVQTPVDGTRVALIGHSYGGYGALLAASQTDRFRAVVAAAGYTDLSRVYALTPHFLVSPDDGVPINALAGWAEAGQGAIGASLSSRPDAYVANSPLYLAERIRTPTLLIEGDLDPVGGDVLFGALYRQGREAALVTYAGEGHVFVSPANLRDLHARILDWLDRYLRPTHISDPRLPALRPDLQHGADQEPIVAGARDQSRLR